MAVEPRGEEGGFLCSCPECGWTAAAPDLRTAVRIDVGHRSANCIGHRMARPPVDSNGH
jgi:hypothetical protein